MSEKQKELIEEEDKKFSVHLAKTFCDIVTSSAFTNYCVHKGKADLKTLIEALGEQVDRTLAGNMHVIESILMTQAQTLNIIFNRMMVSMSESETLDHLQTYSDISFKAQNQSRQTLAVLADLKNPRRATFIKQQNNALLQQINNKSNEENSENIANELLKNPGVAHEKLDIRGTIKTSSIDSQMEALESIDRSKNS